MNLSMKKTVLVASIGLSLAGSFSAADAGLVLTFANGTAVTAKPGACSSIDWIAGAEFRMCDPNGGLGGGVPLQKNAIAGGETYTFDDAGVLTGVTGTPGNPGATVAGSAAPTTNTNDTWQLNANFFGQPFNFLAPVSGSLAEAAYGNATYIGGVPTAGANIPFILAPVLEAQWGNTWFPLGQTFTGANGIDAASGITFIADISNVVTVGDTVTFDFHMYANECIDGAGAVGCSSGGGTEDPGIAGFGGWTAEWHMQGTGTYTNTAAPTVSSVSPTDGAAGVSTTLTEVTVNFSKPMNPATVTSGAISLTGETVGNPDSYNNDMTFVFPITTPPLVASTLHTISFNAGPQDTGGSALIASNQTFTTAAGADGAAPTVTTRSPSSGAEDVSTTTSIAITFSEAMKTTTAGSITVTGPGGAVAGIVTFNAAQTVFTFSPNATLANITTYTVTVAAATAEDVSGNNLAADDSWSFTTVDTTITTIADLNTDPLTSGCTINPRAKFEPTLLAMLFGSFGWLAWRRRRNR
jgi:hypothetical protein